MILAAAWLGRSGRAFNHNPNLATAHLCPVRLRVEPREVGVAFLHIGSDFGAIGQVGFCINYNPRGRGQGCRHIGDSCGRRWRDHNLTGRVEERLPHHKASDDQRNRHQHQQQLHADRRGAQALAKGLRLHIRYRRVIDCRA